MIHPSSQDTALRRAVLIVALLNLAYFGIEFAVAQSIRSVSLFADSIDFLEDAAINLLILLALAWSARKRALMGMLLAGILLIPSIETLRTIWHKFLSPSPPDAALLSITGGGALIVNLVCAFILVRFRQRNCSLTKAAFLSARNDALANVAIIIAGFVTFTTLSGWPDLIVGIGILMLNLGAAKEVYETARSEHKNATNQ